MNRIVVFFVSVLFLLTAAVVFGQGIGWSFINARIRSEFPEVKRISTGELADWLTNTKREKPLLLDVRTRAEFEVSHLASAHQIEPGSAPPRNSWPKTKTIVTYCSVGYRSAKFARKLREAGYENVLNLEGSIFRWANENRPLVESNGRATDKVHPYNRVWGMLVDKSHRSSNESPAVPEKSEH